MDNYNIVSDDTDRVIGVGSSGSSHTNAVVGRRLDQNAGLTLLFFRNSSALSAPESSGSHGAALPSSSNQPDRDTAENQRILIDKLKYRPPRPVIRTIPAPKPAVVSKPVLPSKYPNYLTPKEQLVPDDSTVGDSSKGSLLKKHQIVRTKKASEWLSKEKEEIAAKQIEKQKYLETARDLEQKRRQQMLQDARRRAELPVDILFQDIESVEEKQHSPFPIPENRDSPAMQAPPLSPRPYVPRLSKVHLRSTPGSEKLSSKLRPKLRIAKQLGSDSDSEEDYAEEFDNDFDGKEENVPVIETASSEPKRLSVASEDDDQSDHKGTAKKDLLTLMNEQEQQRRREEGQKYAEERRKALHKQERERKQKEEEEKNAKKLALEKLNKERREAILKADGNRSKTSSTSLQKRGKPKKYQDNFNGSKLLHEDLGPQDSISALTFSRQTGNSSVPSWLRPSPIESATDMRSFLMATAMGEEEQKLLAESPRSGQSPSSPRAFDPYSASHARSSNRASPDSRAVKKIEPENKTSTKSTFMSKQSGSRSAFSAPRKKTTKVSSGKSQSKSNIAAPTILAVATGASASIPFSDFTRKKTSEKNTVRRKQVGNKASKRLSPFEKELFDLTAKTEEPADTSDYGNNSCREDFDPEEAVLKSPVRGVRLSNRYDRPKEASNQGAQVEVDVGEKGESPSNSVVDVDGVKRVLEEVDRMRNLLQQQTEQLRQSIFHGVRDSIDSVDLDTIRSNIHQKIAKQADLFASNSEDACRSSQEAKISCQEDLDGDESYEDLDFPELQESDSDSQSGHEEKKMTTGENKSPHSTSASLSVGDESVVTDDLPVNGYGRGIKQAMNSSRETVGRQFDAITDPYVLHQLALLKDKRDVVKMFGTIPNTEPVDESHTSENYLDASLTYSEPSDFVSPEKAHTAANKQNSPALPSLRNVGELGGLLSSNYLSIFPESSKSVAHAADEFEGSEDSGSDLSDEENEYDYSVVSILAKELLSRKAMEDAHLKDFERPSKDLSDFNGKSSQLATIAEMTTDVEEINERSTLADQGTSTEFHVTFWDELLARSPENEKIEASHKGASTTIHEPVKDFSSSILETMETYAGRASMIAEETGEPEKVRYSGAEMRKKLVEELRRQDEIFNYALELADLEKANTLNAARELTQHVEASSAQELERLKYQQDLQLQQKAYENALAVSAADAHIIMEKSAMQQQEALRNLHSRISVQQFEHEYVNLLSQANEIARNLEQNQVLQYTEQLLHQEQENARVLSASINRKPPLDKHSKFASRGRRSGKNQSKSDSSVGTYHSKDESKSKHVKTISTSQSVSRISVPEEDDVVLTDENDDSYGHSFDEYSVTFESHSRISSSQKEVSSVREDSTVSKYIREVSVQLSERGSERASDRYTNETREEYSTSFIEEDQSNEPGSSKADSEVDSDDNQEIVENSNGNNQSKSATLEVSEVQSSVRSRKSRYEDSDSDEDIVEERATAQSFTKSVDESVTEEVPEEKSSYYSDDYDEADYSERFESSGSVSARHNKEQPHVTKLSNIGTTSKTQMTSISSSALADKNFDSSYMQQILDDYREEMELRLKGQEKSYQLRANFIEMKRSQALKWLDDAIIKKMVSPAEEKDIRERIREDHAAEVSNLERERWELNARSYKELKKYRRLKRDLATYHSNLASGNPPINLIEPAARSLREVYHGYSSSEESFKPSKFLVASNKTKPDSQYTKVISEAVYHRTEGISDAHNEDPDESDVHPSKVATGSESYSKEDFEEDYEEYHDSTGENKHHDSLFMKSGIAGDEDSESEVEEVDEVEEEASSEDDQYTSKADTAYSESARLPVAPVFDNEVSNSIAEDIDASNEQIAKPNAKVYEMSDVMDDSYSSDHFDNASKIVSSADIADVADHSVVEDIVLGLSNVQDSQEVETGIDTPVVAPVLETVQISFPANDQNSSDRSKSSQQDSGDYYDDEFDEEPEQLNKGVPAAKDVSGIVMLEKRKDKDTVEEVDSEIDEDMEKFESSSEDRRQISAESQPHVEEKVESLPIVDESSTYEESFVSASANKFPTKASIDQQEGEMDNTSADQEGRHPLNDKEETSDAWVSSQYDESFASEDDQPDTFKAELAKDMVNQLDHIVEHTADEEESVSEEIEEVEDPEKSDEDRSEGAELPHTSTVEQTVEKAEEEDEDKDSYEDEYDNSIANSNDIHGASPIKQSPKFDENIIEETSDAVEHSHYDESFASEDDQPETVKAESAKDMVNQLDHIVEHTADEEESVSEEIEEVEDPEKSDKDSSEEGKEDKESGSSNSLEAHQMSISKADGTELVDKLELGDDVQEVVSEEVSFVDGDLVDTQEKADTLENSPVENMEHDDLSEGGNYDLDFSEQQLSIDPQRKLQKDEFSASQMIFDPIEQKWIGEEVDLHGFEDDSDGSHHPTPRHSNQVNHDTEKGLRNLAQLGETEVLGFDTDDEIYSPARKVNLDAPFERFFDGPVGANFDFDKVESVTEEIVETASLRSIERSIKEQEEVVVEVGEKSSSVSKQEEKSIAEELDNFDDLDDLLADDKSDMWSESLEGPLMPHEYDLIEEIEIGVYVQSEGEDAEYYSADEEIEHTSRHNVADQSVDGKIKPNDSQDEQELLAEEITDALLKRLLLDNRSDLHSLSTMENYQSTSFSPISDMRDTEAPTSETTRLVEETNEKYDTKQEEVALTRLSDLPPLTRVTTQIVSSQDDELDELYEFDFDGDGGEEDRTMNSTRASNKPIQPEKIISEYDNVHEKLMAEQRLYRSFITQTEKFVDELFEAVDGNRLIDQLSDPSNKNDFVSPLNDRYLYQDSELPVVCDVIVDRINEICCEIHRLRHRLPGNAVLESKSSLSKALIAQNMPMNKDTIKDYVKNVVCQEQNNLVKILDGKKPIHDVLNVDTIDSFPKQMESALSEAGSFIADTLLARLLVDATVTAMDLIQR